MANERLKLKFEDRSAFRLSNVAWITFDGEEITPECMSMTEIEEHLRRLETDISAIRETAQRSFARAKQQDGRTAYRPTRREAPADAIDFALTTGKIATGKIEDQTH